MMANQDGTYEHYVLKTIMPAAPGWQAVYWDDKAQEHFVGPIYALSVAFVQTYECHTRKLLSDHRASTQVVGITYSPLDGFDVAEDARNFCTYLPPGQSLEEFETHPGYWCHNHHKEKVK
jgi:hypothetical protein